MTIAYEDARLEGKHDDFRLLMEEYHDGILLFELTDRKVWSRAVRDTTGLQAFWEENKDDYAWKTRIDGRSSGAPMSPPPSASSRWPRPRAAMWKPCAAKWFRRTRSASPWRKAARKSGPTPFSTPPTKSCGRPGITPFEEVDGQIRFVVLRSVEPPTGKTLDEARGKVIADYQDYLETTWIAELRNTYPYEVDRAVLHTIR